MTKNKVTPATALPLARYFGTTSKVWLSRQANYVVEMLRDSNQVAIKAISVGKIA